MTPSLGNARRCGLAVLALTSTLGVTACSDITPQPLDGPQVRAATPAKPVDPWAPGAPGVVALQGVRYKIIKTGSDKGIHPKRSDDIVVRYEGRLLDGKVFDSSKADKNGLDTFPLSRLIPGWVATVQLMRPGDEWQVYVPAYLAYGEKGSGPIPPNADLVFDIELVSVTVKK